MPAPTVLAGVNAGANILGAALGYRQSNKWNAQQQRNWERQFYSSVQARVADAKKAGISPLAALGMQGSPGPTNFSVRGGGSDHLAGLTNAMFEAELRKTEAETAKTRAEASAVTQQQQLARRLHEQKLRAIAARSSLLSVENPRTPLYARHYDNRAAAGPLKDGEMWLVSPQVAESLEGTGALAAAAYGNFPLDYANYLKDELTKPPSQWFSVDRELWKDRWRRYDQFLKNQADIIWDFVPGLK